MPSKRPSAERRHGDRGILRAAADELGITTPKAADRPRRKGPIRVKVLKGRRSYERGGPREAGFFVSWQLCSRSASPSQRL
jgi:hypothetical protein